MFKKHIISQLLIVLSILGNFHCAYIHRPMRLSRRGQPRQKIQKEDSGQVYSGWTHMYPVSTAYGPPEMPHGMFHHHHHHEPHESNVLEAVSELHDEVNKMTSEFLGVMGPFLFPLPFFLAILPFAIPAIPIAIYLETIGERKEENHPHGNNSQPTMGPHTGVTIKPVIPVSPSPSKPSPTPKPPVHNSTNSMNSNMMMMNNNNNNNNNGNNNNGNSSFGNPVNPTFPPDPPFMMMNSSFTDDPGFPPFTPIDFNTPAPQPVEITFPPDSSNPSMSSGDPELPPITFPSSMIDVTQSTPFSLFQFPIFLNSSYLEVTDDPPRKK